MRQNPRDRVVVYYPAPHHYPHDRRPQRRKSGTPAIIWPGLPIGVLAALIISGAMDHAHKAAQAARPAPPPKVVTHTIIRHVPVPVPAHAMPGWEALGITALIVFAVIAVAALAVHGYRSRS